MQLIHSRRDLFAGIGLLVVALGINAALGLHFAGRLHRNWTSVNHTHEVLESIEALNIAIVDAESAQRGFLITGDEKFLDPYQASLANYKSITSRLQKLTRAHFT